MPFAFTPATGLSDTAAYPTTPVNEAAARQQVMDPLNQIRDYMNNSLARKNPPTSWITPTLVNGWVYFGSGSDVTYMKDDLGFVHLKGKLKNGVASSVMFTLPSGYRPIKTINVAARAFESGNVFAACGIGSDGTVSVVQYVNEVNIDGISFLAEL